MLRKLLSQRVVRHKLVVGDDFVDLEDERRARSPAVQAAQPVEDPFSELGLFGVGAVAARHEEKRPLHAPRAPREAALAQLILFRTVGRARRREDWVGRDDEVDRLLERRQEAQLAHAAQRNARPHARPHKPRRLVE